MTTDKQAESPIVFDPRTIEDPTIQAEPIRTPIVDTSTKQPVEVTVTEPVVVEQKPVEVDTSKDPINVSYNAVSDNTVPSIVKEDVLDKEETPMTETEIMKQLSHTNFAQLHLGNGTELDALLGDYEKEIGKSLQDAFNDRTVDQWIADLIQVAQRGLNSQQADLTAQALKSLKENNQTLKASPPGGLSDGKSYTSVNGMPPVLTGKEARIAVTARLRGVRKATLMNSGFNVVARPLQLSELNEFVNSVKDEAKEYGRTLGGHFYLFIDVFCKAKFMELFRGCVIDCNLVGWDVGNTLLENIVIQDYETCIWAVMSLMYRDGCPVDIFCTDSKCRHLSSDQLIDLNKSKYFNYDIMPQEAISFIGKVMAVGSRVSVDQAKHYRNNLLKFDKTISSKQVRYELQVPTMARYLEIGVQLVGDMLAAIQSDDTSTNNRDVTTALALNIYRMYAPWVRQVVYLKPDKSVDFTTEDLGAIMDSLEGDHIEDVDFNIDPEIVKFITATKITYMCSISLECPKCHKKPSGAIEDYFPLDLARYFFFLACQQLMKTGLRSTNT